MSRFRFALTLFCCFTFCHGATLAQPQGAPNASPYIQLSDGQDKPVESEKKKREEKKERKRSGHISVASLEKQALETVNKNRVAAGLSALPLNEKLSDFARNFAEKMKKDNFFAHVDKQGHGAQERAKEAGIECGIYENLGWQSGDESDLDKLDAIDKSFMSEPVGERNHRYNILKAEHTNVGIGIVVTKDQLWLVQEFSDSEP